MPDGRRQSSEVAIVRTIIVHAAIVLAASVRIVCAQTTINMSHDLVPLGIAGQNMVPNALGEQRDVDRRRSRGNRLRR